MFSTFEIVKDLCEKQGISLNTLEDKLKLGKKFFVWVEEESTFCRKATTNRRLLQRIHRLPARTNG